MFDDSGNIGKCYARQDEIGTPFCVTVDHQSLEDAEVTIRDRDTLAQDRVAVERLQEYLFDRMKS
jgi:glycyl-tRNA synthetase